MEFSVVTAHGTTPTKRAYHSCSVVGNILFVFGGAGEDKTVLNSMDRCDIESDSWSKVETVPGSSSTVPKASRSFPKGTLCDAPSLSHHTATVVKDRYIITIGGWNGKKRVSDVHCFDTSNSTWRRINVSGDVPVGLSSHTATLVSPKDILIVGREGGVRTQRRFSGAFNLDVETGRYTEAPFHTASRSGHTSNLIHVRTSKEFHLLIFGGRKSGGYELLGGWTHKETQSQGMTTLEVKKLLSHCVACQEPDGRQHCQCIEIGNRYLMFYGGEKWSGVRENVTNEAYLLDTQNMIWYNIPVNENIPKLVGHTMCVVMDKVMVFGGNIQNKPCNMLWNVNFV